MSDKKCRICNPDLSGEDNICDECKLFIITLTPLIIKATLNALLAAIKSGKLDEHLLRLQAYINKVNKEKEETKNLKLN